MALETGFLRASVGHAADRRQTAERSIFLKKPGLLGWCVNPSRVKLMIVIFI